MLFADSVNVLHVGKGDDRRPVNKNSFMVKLLKVGPFEVYGLQNFLHFSKYAPSNRDQAPCSVSTARGLVTKSLLQPSFTLCAMCPLRL